ncbi:hypothetical protein HMSSN036_39960 [Paenibacillus macerans]|nr:hypothetical protein HMSSN036_39960 [Paenibacillus macerans]
MQPSMLVTNNKLDMTVKSANIPRLETYLNTVNAKNDFTDTIWFGIVPSVELESAGKVKVSRERFKGNEKIVKQDGNNMESLAMLLTVVKEFKVQVSSASNRARRRRSTTSPLRESTNTSTNARRSSARITANSPSRACRTLRLSPRRNRA